MIDQTVQDPPGASVTSDRRKPRARYVEFVDEEIQAQLVAAAEDAHHRLVAYDRFAPPGEVELPSAPPAQPEPHPRRGLFHKSSPQPVVTEPVMVETTAALAKAARTATDAPDQVQSSPHGCAASHRVARILATVLTELVNDLLKLEPDEQAAHPAYRQTLWLAAELEALREIVTRLGCADPGSCVGVPHDKLVGRRGEDAEVDAVRDVLVRLAKAGEGV